MPKEYQLTEKPAARCVLVLVHEDRTQDEYEEEELASLVHAAGAEPVAVVIQRVAQPNTATYIGKGKTEELLGVVLDVKADAVVFDCELTGVQHRNLSDILRCRVIDRTQLILDIFAQRAHTKEGKLQVELAQLTYMMPKITAVYTEFERQKGGIGMRGPGETKLEADRRRLKTRIAAITADIEEVRASRKQQRASRRKYPFPFACLVGYTSAGKSTIMNALSQSEVFTDPMLFATLDPTTRKVSLPDGYSVFITDTVGFVRRLPTQLVAAFQSTLEEVVEADFHLHIVDVSHPSWQAQMDSVLETLQTIGAANKPVLTVFNKIDKVTDPALPRNLVAQFPHSVAVSALTGNGMDALIKGIVKLIRNLLKPINVLIPYEKSQLLQDCYDLGRVIEVRHGEDGIAVRAEVIEELASKLQPYTL